MSYEDLLNIDELWNKKDYFKEERWGVAYYCKTCEKLVEVSRPNPRGYKFVCDSCDSDAIVLGTKEGLISNYRIK